METERQISYSFRINETLMAQATRLAAIRDEKMAQVIRKAIRAYTDSAQGLRQREEESLR